MRACSVLANLAKTIMARQSLKLGRSSGEVEEEASWSVERIVGHARQNQ